MPYLDWVAGPISLVEALVVALIALLKPWLLPLFALSRHSLLPLFALLQHCILRPSPLGEGLGVRLFLSNNNLLPLHLLAFKQASGHQFEITCFDCGQLHGLGHGVILDVRELSTQPTLPRNEVV